ncbi:MAG: pyroglutamyl-peptidase I [Verrucomicrobia bacterium]|nr:MAG: pyroglutamyl-peptidase I [Verrucomicrobiota bacterium]
MKAPERCVLVTGFEPFGGDRVNASEQAVRALAERAAPSAVRVVVAILPCVFGGAGRELLALVRRHRPEVIICVGEAGGRAEISLERVALNWEDARLPDNAGAQPMDRPVVADGPTAYWSKLPLRAALEALLAEGLPARLSETAGTFVCNHTFYALMHALRRRRVVRAGFVHVPCLPMQADLRTGKQPCLPLEKTVRALELVMTCALQSLAGPEKPAG